MYYVYLVRCKDTTLYCGYTDNLVKRIEMHNSSTKGAKYTKNRRPVFLVYYETFEDKSSALRREFEIKKLSKLQKEELVKIFNIQIPQ
jgi:putative endonuclease